MEQVIKRLERLIKILRINPNYKLDEIDISNIEKLVKEFKNISWQLILLYI